MEFLSIQELFTAPSGMLLMIIKGHVIAYFKRFFIKEDLKFKPNPNLFLSTGGRAIKLWRAESA